MGHLPPCVGVWKEPSPSLPTAGCLRLPHLAPFLSARREEENVTVPPLQTDGVAELHLSLQQQTPGTIVSRALRK